MKTKVAYEKARAFMKRHARILDKALFEFECESGSIENVLTELRPFQNPDGGFGNALEPDIRCTDSSAVATVTGLQILSALGTSEDHRMVQAAICYLLSTFHSDTMSWPSVPKEVSSSPHAPWWTYSEPTHDETKWATEERVNASIVGFLHEFAGLVPPNFLADVTNHALNCFDSSLEHGTVDISFVQLAERLSGVQHDRVYSKLASYIKRICATSVDEWNVARFYYVAHPQNSKYVTLATEVMPFSVDYIISEQTEDGSWPVGFSWDGYKDGWKEAELEWKGIITRGQLSLLRRFGALDLVIRNDRSDRPKLLDIK